MTEVVFGEGEVKTWEIIVTDITKFGEHIPEKAYVKHIMLEPKARVCFTEPIMVKSKPTCLCGTDIPDDIFKEWKNQSSTITGL